MSFVKQSSRAALYGSPALRVDFAVLGQGETSRRATTPLPPGRGHQREYFIPLGDGEVVPPQKLTLQRLEELQVLNAKLLLDNSTLHRLYTQQVASSPGASAVNYRRTMGYMPSSSATAAVARHADASGSLRCGKVSLSQNVSSMSKDVLQSSRRCVKVRPEVPAAASRTLHGAAASVSPVSSASLATPPSVVAPQRVPYCLGVTSPANCRSPASAFAHADTRYEFPGSQLPMNASLAAQNPPGAFVVDQVGCAVAHRRPSPFTEEVEPVASAFDATEINRSGAPRCVSPQVLPSLRRELWQSSGPIAISSPGITYAHPSQADEYTPLQTRQRPEDRKLREERAMPDQAQLYRQEQTRIGDNAAPHVYAQQAFREQPCSQPSPIFQQPVLVQTTSQPPPPLGAAAGVIDMVVPSWRFTRSGAARTHVNALGQRANSTRRLGAQRVHPECMRQPGGAPSTANTGTPGAHGATPAIPVQRAFPRLPQYAKGGKLQGSQQETACRPAVTPSSSVSHLPLLQNCASGSNTAQAQRQQRMRALSSVGSGVSRRLPVTQSLTLLQQGNGTAQSQRTLHSRSHSQFITTVADNSCMEPSGAPTALFNRGMSPPRSENAARIDLTVWGQGMKHKGKTRYPSAANSAAPAGRPGGIAIGGGRHATDGITAKVFHRTRRASAAVSADYFPALTPAHSDSRLLAAAEERHKRQLRGGCALGRCWLGFSTPADNKTRDANHHTPQAPNPWLHASLSTKHLQSSPSSTQDAARLRAFSPVPNFASWTKDHMNSVGSSLPARDSTPVLQSHMDRAVPLSPIGGTPAHSTLHAVKASPVMLPFQHNAGTGYANYHTLASSPPPVIVPRASQMPKCQGLSPAGSPFFTALPASAAAGVHIPNISLPPACVMSPALSSSQVLYNNGRISNYCPESVAPQPRLTTEWIGEGPKTPDKIPAAQELWQTSGAAH